MSKKMYLKGLERRERKPQLRIRLHEIQHAVNFAERFWNGHNQSDNTNDGVGLVGKEQR